MHSTFSITSIGLFSVTSMLLVGCSPELPTVVQYEKEGMHVASSNASISSHPSNQSTEVSEIIPDADGNVIEDHVQFSVGNLRLSVRKEVSEAYKDVENLTSSSGESCKLFFSESKMNELRKQYPLDKKILYTIYDPEVSMNAELYYIEILPNRMAHDDFDYNADNLGVCSVGNLPAIILGQWIIFANTACGGASLNGDACDKTQKIIRKSIQWR